MVAPLPCARKFFAASNFGRRARLHFPFDPLSEVGREKAGLPSPEARRGSLVFLSD